MEASDLRVGVGLGKDGRRNEFVGESFEGVVAEASSVGISSIELTDLIILEVFICFLNLLIFAYYALLEIECVGKRLE